MRVAAGPDGAAVTVARVTEPSLPDIRTHGAGEQRRDGGRQKARYLPSAQVLAELACLGPDLLRLADDIRDRLSEADASIQP